MVAVVRTDEEHRAVYGLKEEHEPPVVRIEMLGKQSTYRGGVNDGLVGDFRRSLGRSESDDRESRECVRIHIGRDASRNDHDGFQDRCVGISDRNDIVKELCHIARGCVRLCVAVQEIQKQDVLWQSFSRIDAEIHTLVCITLANPIETLPYSFDTVKAYAVGLAPGGDKFVESDSGVHKRRQVSPKSTDEKVFDAFTQSLHPPGAYVIVMFRRLGRRVRNCDGSQGFVRQNRLCVRRCLLNESADYGVFV